MNEARDQVGVTDVTIVRMSVAVTITKLPAVQVVQRMEYHTESFSYGDEHGFQ
jgi:hypothetical protein